MRQSRPIGEDRMERNHFSEDQNSLLGYHITLPLLLLLILASGVQAAYTASFAEKSAREETPLSYNQQVRPILSNHCFPCHGPDSAARKAELRLDSFEDSTRKRTAGAAITPGDAELSLLFQRITSSDEQERMPPPEIHKEMTQDQIAVIRRWIEEGAQYEAHWSFQTPQQPRVPDIAPQVASTPIDALIRSELQSWPLSWRERASKEALIRRATFDLTGLPPTLKEIDDFLSDTEADAWNKVLDRLLESSRFGEHWGRIWLDAARYADTHGLHLDNYREMWPYRDKVIELFNENIPYDEFVKGQLAGDLLPEASLEDQIASGFVRAHPTTSEGGAINEEYRMIYSVDRTNTFGTVFLGLTVGCAQCHDHKFDPVTQEDYFGLYSFFNNTAEAEMDGNAKAHPPVVKVPTEEQKLRQTALTQQVEEMKKQQSAPQQELDAAQKKFETKWLAEENRWHDFEVDTFETSSASTLEPLGDGSYLAAGENPAQDIYTFSTVIDAGVYKALRIEGLLHESLPGGGPGRAGNSNIVLTEIEGTVESLDAEGLAQGEAVAVDWKHAYADHQQPNWPVTAAIDGNITLDDGWAVEGIQRKERRVAIFASDTPFGTTGQVKLTLNLHFASRYIEHGLGRVRLSLAHDFMPPHFDTVWGDDASHPAKKLVNNGSDKDWNWVSGDDHPIHSGKRSRLQKSTTDRIVQHYFNEAHDPITVNKDDQFYVWAWLDPENPPKTVMLQVHSAGSWEHRAYWGEDLINFGTLGVDTPGHRPMGDLPKTGEWVRLQVSADQIGFTPGNVIDGYAFTQFGGHCYWDDYGISGYGQTLELETLLTGPTTLQDERTSSLLRDLYRARHSPEYKVMLQEIAEQQKALEQLNGKIPTTLVASERMDMRPARLLARGQYDQPLGEPIPPKVPSFLPPLPEGAPANRLGLAQWLTSSDHPLFSRVTVNRIWQQLFGTGLVSTSEDFGAQGEWPSHPELLDFLATDFIDRDWNLKQFIRSLMLTDTYCMETVITPESLDKDPRNRYLARGPRFRLDAEMIRDQALFLSGLLVEKMGGPGVKPYQPDGLWKAVGYVDSNTVKFVQDKGESLYRRSVYTFWKRTSPPPYLAIFNAPNRETCVVKRERTNTPMQALLLMNDVQYLECARVLAENLLTDVSELSDRDKLQRLWRIATSRTPADDELDELAIFLNSMRDRFLSDPTAAKELLSTGEMPRDMNLNETEHAAWMLVCSLVMNLDEVVMKG